METLNKQVGGNHYKQFPIQPVELCYETNLPFLEGCVVKYVCRYKYKHGLEDLNKALHFVEMLIDFKWKYESSFLGRLFWKVKGWYRRWKHGHFVTNFCIVNNLERPEQQLITILCVFHGNMGELYAIRNLIQDLIQKYKQENKNDRDN